MIYRSATFEAEEPAGIRETFASSGHRVASLLCAGQTTGDSRTSISKCAFNASRALLGKSIPNVPCIVGIMRELLLCDTCIYNARSRVLVSRIGAGSDWYGGRLATRLALSDRGIEFYRVRT